MKAMNVLLFPVVFQTKVPGLTLLQKSIKMLDKKATKKALNKLLKRKCKKCSAKTQVRTGSLSQDKWTSNQTQEMLIKVSRLLRILLKLFFHKIDSPTTVSKKQNVLLTIHS